MSLNANTVKILPPLFQEYGHVYSSCVWRWMLHASETWPLTKPNLQHLRQNDRAMIRQICMSSQKTLSPQDPLSLLSAYWGSEEGLAGMDMWLTSMVQSRQPWHTGWWKAWAWDVRWHGSSWQREIAESGSFRLSTLMIDILGDLTWDLPCMQQGSCLEGMLHLYLHVNQKSYDDDDDDDDDDTSIYSVSWRRFEIFHEISHKCKALSGKMFRN